VEIRAGLSLARAARPMDRLKARAGADSAHERGLAGVTITRLNEALRGWFGYFQHSHSTTFPNVDSYIRGRLRSILRKRADVAAGAGGTIINGGATHYFDKLGLFNLTTSLCFGTSVSSLRHSPDWRARMRGDPPVRFGGGARANQCLAPTPYRRAHPDWVATSELPVVRGSARTRASYTGHIQTGCISELPVLEAAPPLKQRHTILLMDVLECDDLSAKSHDPAANSLFPAIRSKSICPTIASLRGPRGATAGSLLQPVSRRTAGAARRRHRQR